MNAAHTIGWIKMKQSKCLRLINTDSTMYTEAHLWAKPRVYRQWLNVWDFSCTHEWQFQQSEWSYSINIKKPLKSVTCIHVYFSLGCQQHTHERYHQQQCLETYDRWVHYALINLSLFKILMAIVAARLE